MDGWMDGWMDGLIWESEVDFAKSLSGSILIIAE
jgi:hypothetical protein